MRFGWNLQQSQIPEWATHYIDYKGLKQLVKTIKARSPEQATAGDTAELLALLDRNLDKIDQFYTKKYATYAKQLGDIQHDNKDDPASTDREAAQELRLNLFELREQYRKLQWYAEVNRRGFYKITKKIDKNLDSLATRQQYMELKVESKTFASHAAQSEDLVLITDWLARLDNIIASACTTPAVSVPPSPRLTATSSQTSLEPLDEPPIDVDTALRTDDSQACCQHLLLAQRHASTLDQAKIASTFLQRAISARAYDCVRYLLQRLPDLGASAQHDKRNCLHRYLVSIGRSKVSLLISSGRRPTSMANRLLDKQKSDTDSEQDPFDQDVTTAFLQHILDHLSVTQRVILNARDVHGRMPLHYAGEYGLMTAAQAIVTSLKAWHMYNTSNAVDTEDWHDNDGHAPLHLAVLGGHPKTATTLLLAESSHDPGVATITPQSRGEMTSAVLSYAVKSQMPISTRLLIDAGADMNVPNDAGETPMHTAARQGSEACLQALVTGSCIHKPDLNIADKTYGFTPLFHACVEGHETIVEILAAAGANVDVYDRAGWRPIEHASWHGHINTALKMYDLATEMNKQVARQEEPKFEMPKAAHASMILDAPLPRKCLTNETMILVSLGSMDTRQHSPAVTLEGIERSIQQDTALSLLVTIDGGSGDPVTVDLPTHDDLSCFPITFMTPNPSKVRLLFDIVPTRGSKAEKHLLGRAVGQLSSMMPIIGLQRTTLQGFRTTPILAATPTMDVIGSVSFNFLVINPFVHPDSQDQRFVQRSQKPNSTMIIGHRGWGMNLAGNRRLQMGENTIGAFQTAARSGVPFVEFDVQLTKDHVPVVYHDFLVSETGIDAPVHTLTLEQFLHASKIASDHAEPTGPGLRPRAKSTSLTFVDHRIDMDHRMKYTRDFKEAGYKPNSRGKVIHEGFTTLEGLLKSMPDPLGLNIEMKFPSLVEVEDHAMDNYAVELNSFADAVLDQIYKHCAGRPIVFSSFHPDMCIVLRLKQPHFPVMFLTDAGTWPVSDVRAGSLREAHRFATRWDIAGVVSHVQPLFLCPRLIRVMQSSGLRAYSYGPRNTSADVTLALIRAGIDAVIVDDVQAIKKGMEAIELEKQVDKAAV